MRTKTNSKRLRLSIGYLKMDWLGIGFLLFAVRDSFLTDIIENQQKWRKIKKCWWKCFSLSSSECLIVIRAPISCVDHRGFPEILPFRHLIQLPHRADYSQKNPPIFLSHVSFYYLYSSQTSLIDKPLKPAILKSKFRFFIIFSNYATFSPSKRDIII